MRKTEINLHIEEAIAIRPQRALVAYCRWCRKQERMIAANDAAMISGFSAREVYRFVEDGQLHFAEDQNGLLFICVAALDQLVNGGHSIPDRKEEQSRDPL